MNYTIIVKGFRKKSARMVVARQLVREAGITLHEALAQTEHLPITLVRSIGRETVGSMVDRYGRLGIDVQAIEAIPRIAAMNENDVPLIPPVAAQRHRREPHYSKTSDHPGGNGQHIRIPPAQPFPALPKRQSSMPFRNWMVLGGIIVSAAAVLYGLFLLSQFSAPAGYNRALAKRGETGMLGASGQTKKTVVNRSGMATGRIVTPAARERARRLVDSAQAFGTDPESAIRFYTMAIAFNKNNVNAWFGLLDAYKRSGRTSDAEMTRQAMRKIFGERGISIKSVIRPFGDLTEMHSENGTLTIEYRTKSPLVRDKLLRETFLIYRAIRNDCSCSAISLFAFRDGSNGLVVHLNTNKEMVSVAEFTQKATVSFFNSSAGKKSGAATR